MANNLHSVRSAKRWHRVSAAIFVCLAVMLLLVTLHHLIEADGWRFFSLQDEGTDWTSMAEPPADSTETAAGAPAEVTARTFFSKRHRRHGLLAIYFLISSAIWSGMVWLLFSYRPMAGRNAVIVGSIWIATLTGVIALVGNRWHSAEQGALVVTGGLWLLGMFSLRGVLAAGPVYDSTAPATPPGCSATSNFTSFVLPRIRPRSLRIRDLFQAGSREWPQIELLGNRHEIPKLCPSCVQPAADVRKTTADDGAVRYTQTFFYCAECARAVDLFHSLRHILVGLYALVAMAALCLPLLIAALLSLDIDRFAVPLLLSGFGVLAVLTPWFLPLFSVLRRHYQSSAPVRPGQIVWGPAVWLLRFTKRGTIYRAAHPEWIKALVAANPDRIDPVIYRHLVAKQEPPAAPTTNAHPSDAPT